MPAAEIVKHLRVAVDEKTRDEVVHEISLLCQQDPDAKEVRKAFDALAAAAHRRHRSCLMHTSTNFLNSLL
jgi:hypothetical protein